MREIKFRGLIGITNKWVYFNLHDLVMDPEKKKSFEFINTNTITQSTGLKDKNGKEIYEGDIVEWKYLNTWQRNEVKYIGDCFMAMTSAFKDDLNELQGLSLISKLECKVIGNIYESKDLLV